jgi:hypothetical protein
MSWWHWTNGLSSTSAVSAKDRRQSELLTRARCYALARHPALEILLPVREGLENERLQGLSNVITGSKRGATWLPGYLDAGKIRVWVTLEEQQGVVREIRASEGRSRQSRRISDHDRAGRGGGCEGVLGAASGGRDRMYSLQVRPL